MGKEERLTHQEAIPPLPGRAFHLHLRPAPRLTWVGAGWAAVCGIVAAGALHLTADTAVRVLLTLVLVDPVLGAVWAALLRIRGPSGSEPSGSRDQTAVEDLDIEPRLTSFWASIGSSLGWRVALRLFGSRPLKPSSGRGMGLRRGLGTLRARWSDLIATHGRHVAEVGLLSGLALLLGLVLGQGVATVVALGLLFPLVVWFALGGYPLRHGWTRAALEIGLPWTVGLVAFTSFPAVKPDGLSGLMLSAVFWAGEHGTALAVGLLFAVAYCGKLTLDRPLQGIRRPVLMTLPQIVAVVLLVAWHQPILAGTAALLVLAQMLFQPYLGRHQIRWYLRTTQWMFMGVMLVVALGVAARHL